MVTSNVAKGGIVTLLSGLGMVLGFYVQHALVKHRETAFGARVDAAVERELGERLRRVEELERNAAAHHR